jgi:hypothetical protein
MCDPEMTVQPNELLSSGMAHHAAGRLMQAAECHRHGAACSLAIRSRPCDGGCRAAYATAREPCRRETGQNGPNRANAAGAGEMDR